MIFEDYPSVFFVFQRFSMIPISFLGFHFFSDAAVISFQKSKFLQKTAPAGAAELRPGAA